MMIPNKINNASKAIITISGANTSSQIHAIKPNSLASTNISVSSNRKLHMLNHFRVLFDLVNLKVAPFVMCAVCFVDCYDWH